MKRRYGKPLLPRCDGFSLIEVLVTSILIAIGLLSLAAWQQSSLKAYRYGMSFLYGQEALNQLTEGILSSRSSQALTQLDAEYISTHRVSAEDCIPDMTCVRGFCHSSEFFQWQMNLLSCQIQSVHPKAQIVLNCNDESALDNGVTCGSGAVVRMSVYWPYFSNNPQCPQRVFPQQACIIRDVVL
jgi:prepilin-type N-terminal cleavage/methylation domain-containing protein